VECEVWSVKCGVFCVAWRLKVWLRESQVFSYHTALHSDVHFRLRQLQEIQPRTTLKCMCIFPECVVKGSCFLPWRSGGGRLFARRFVFCFFVFLFFSVIASRVVLLSMGKGRKGDVL